MGDGFEKRSVGLLGGHFLAEVVSVEDPLAIGRVQVRVYNADGVADHDAPVWARVAVPFAGGDRGAFLVPDVGDEVLIAFVNGDPRFPVVVGSMWNGNAAPPETLPGSRVDRWTLVGKNGTRIAIVEENASQEKILLTTPNEVVSALLTAEAGGKLELKTPSATVTLDTGGVTITTSLEVKVEAGAGMKVTAPSVQVDAAMVKCSGVVKCESLIATTVIGTTYTPGVGNLW